MVGIYRNPMTTTAQRAQLVKLAGSSCTRGGSDGALRIASPPGGPTLLHAEIPCGS